MGNQLLMEKSVDLRDKNCVSPSSKMRIGRQSVSPHSLPVPLLWMDCSMLHFRPLPMSAERGGIRKFPVMPYRASQRRGPIHAHGMRQHRAIQHSIHDPTPASTKAKTSMRVRMNERTGSCKSVPCLLMFPGRSLPPAKSIRPQETIGLKSLKGEGGFQEGLGPGSQH